MTDFKNIQNALIACDAEKLIVLVREAVENGIDANQILNEGLISGMDVVGDLSGI